MTGLLSNRDLNRALLARQLLLDRAAATPVEVIEKLAGLQSQEPGPPFTGIWTRTREFQPDQLRELIHAREVVRGTMMRGTIHLMTTRDYLDLRPTIQDGLEAFLGAVRRQLETLDCHRILARAADLLNEDPRPIGKLIPALAAEFPKADIEAIRRLVRTRLPMILKPADDPRGYKANAPFLPAATWLGTNPVEGEPVTTLIRRYLAAFGPASPADFRVWSGLRGVTGYFEDLRPELLTFSDERGRELFDLPEAPRPGSEVEAPARCIPAFDNLTLSHDGRERIISADDQKLIMTKNGRIPPMFLWDGFAAGTWSVESSKGKAALTLNPFATLPREAREPLKEEGRLLLEFLEPGAKIHSVRLGAKVSRN